jgi:DNA-binding NarL/FixJ family response regulator
VRGAIRSFLEARTAYRVCGDVGDAAAAIEKATEFKCDLILLGPSGSMTAAVETASILRGILPQAKIVGFSMGGEEAGAQMVVPASFDAILSKHDGLAKLSAIVRMLLPAPAKKQAP